MAARVSSSTACDYEALAMNPPVLSYSNASPPVALLIASRIGAVSLKLLPWTEQPSAATPTLVFDEGTKLIGVQSILRYVARHSSESSNLYGTDALDSTMVDQWLDQSDALTNGASFTAICEMLSTFLATRTYLVGSSLTIADLAIWERLFSSRQWDAIKNSPPFYHLKRWGKLCELDPRLIDIVTDPAVNAKRPYLHAKRSAVMSEKNQGKEVGGSFDIDLEGASEGNVVTRFPPEPSGYLHIGHAKAALLNQYFARQYNGKLIIRFDDTNPSKEKDEFVDNILLDCDILGLKADMVTYTSDSFQQILEMGTRLIKEGSMYVDDTPMDKMREERINRIESVARTNSIETNLKLWKHMIDGDQQGLKCAARFLMDMQNDNGALRDPVAFRCNLIPHHRTGTKYKVYPTYDCACPFVDALEVHIWDYSRLNFVYTTLSKRKLQWFVDEGYADGWDDPRFPTVQGMRRRGLQTEALKEFILMQGASRNVNLMEWEKLWTLNKRIIDPVCPRHVAVADKGKVLVIITNGPSHPEVVSVAKHKKFPPAGVKATTRTSRIWLDVEDAMSVREGEEVTLMDWGNCIIDKIIKDSTGQYVVSIEARLHLEGSVKSTKLKLTWLPNISDLVPLTLFDFDYLITKKKVEDDDSLADVVNATTKIETHAHGDANMRTLQKGNVIQLERKGYFIIDKVFVRSDTPMVLFAIPDGRIKTWGVSAGVRK